MTLEELAIVLGETIEYRFPDINKNYMCNFDSCEVKKGAMLEGTCGHGATIEEARASYLRQIRDQRIVFHSTDEKYRREFVVPASIA